MKYLYLLLLIIPIIGVFLLRVSIYIKQGENTEFRLKIGFILRIKLHNKKIIEICRRISMYDFTVLNNKEENNNSNKLFKKMTVEKITVINQNNIFNCLWNVYIPFSNQMFNIYLEQTLLNRFKKVKNRYYSIMYTTTGTYKLMFELVLSIRFYQIVKYCINNLINKKKVKYDKSN